MSHDPPPLERSGALALHARSVVIDGLDVSVLDAEHWRQMQRGGVTAANVTVTVAGDYRSTSLVLADLNERIAANPDVARPVRSVADIHAAKAEGRVGLIYGFQNATPIETDLRFIGLFAEMGVRIFQLAWNAANLVGDSCQESRGGGLTAFGRAVVQELNERHLLIDLSHCDERTTLDTFELSSAPVAITHANPISASPIKRNKSDHVIRKLADKGGVMGIVAISEFLASDVRDADLRRYCDQIDYVASLVGIDHVAIGSDFTERLPRSFLEPVPWGAAELGPCELTSYVETGLFPFPYAKGLESAAELPNVTVELVRRGFSDTDVQKVLGLNWLRLFGQVWSD